jgi:hypothetical protein
MFCRSLFVILTFFFWPLCCLSFFDLRILITPLVSPSFSSPIDGVMVSLLASSGVDCGFEPRSVQTKDYKIGICCFSAEDAPLRSKSKDWLIRNQDNVSEWNHMSTRGLLLLGGTY